MKFLTGTCTDVGTRKKTNQDSMIVMQAETTYGPVLFASVCDGMGGLAKGEVASAAMVRKLEAWFMEGFPELIANGFSVDKLWEQWRKVILEAAAKISAYGVECHTDLGTTCAAVLIYNNNFYTCNVGDSRVYLISDNVYQLTKDQTYVQREIDAGRMTYEQSLVDPNRSVLLQCIGASQFVDPVFTSGPAGANQVFLLCCDGFRHVVTASEFYQFFHPSVMTSEKVIAKRLKEVTQLNIDRREDDNISAILVKTY